MNSHGRTVQRAEAAPSTPMEAADRRAFGVALALAGMIHVALIVLIAAGVRRHEKPQVQWIELLPEGMLTGGGAAPAAHPEVAPAPQRNDPSPVVEPRTEPKPEPKSESKPAPKPEPKPPPQPKPAPPKPAPVVPAPKPVLPQPAPSPTPVQKTVPKPAPPKKEPVKVSLDEVTRPAKTAAPPKEGAARTEASAAPSAPGMDADEVRQRLDKRLGRTIVTGALPEGSVGAGGAGSGGVSSEVAEYYALIRDIYYNAWRPPGHAHLTAIARIRVAADGRVLSAKVERGSGDAGMDASVEAATAAVSEIGRPLPAALGSQFADVTITFEF